MQEFISFFGVEFKNLRLAKNLSQWDIALKIPYHIRNIQRIEQGVSQPGISLAFKLIQALNAQPGEFLSELATKYKAIFPTSISPLNQISISYILPDTQEIPKSLFGPLLLQARVASCISQTAMAKAAGYNLRNINAVERGKQEPGIITALSLVLATGVDVKEFFNTLYVWWIEKI